jgi:uncharacterized membrane protein
MSNMNTMFSYSLRFVVVLHATLLGLLFAFQKSPVPGGSSFLKVSATLVIIILVLLIADWVTRKEQARRFSKLIDSIIGVGWLLAILVAVLRSLSMGTM